VTERRVHDGLDDFRGCIRFADAFQAAVRAHPDQNDILATGGLMLYGGNSEDLADDVGNLHALRIQKPEASEKRFTR
jgi:hypothetical protein